MLGALVTRSGTQTGMPRKPQRCGRFLIAPAFAGASGRRDQLRLSKENLSAQNFILDCEHLVF
jgi:hypothetical protein